MKTKVIYPGSFDPITFGHIDLVKRAVKIFDELIVAVAHSKDKSPLFNIWERVNMANRAVKHIPNVKVEDFNQLTIDYVRAKKACAIIRGVRMISDFEYEFQMALTNRKLADDIETIFMMPNESYSYLSSRLLKEAASLGANLEKFVPKYVSSALRKKFRNK